MQTSELQVENEIQQCGGIANSTRENQLNDKNCVRILVKNGKSSLFFIILRFFIVILWPCCCKLCLG